jgi:hypothetical protein
MVCQGALGEAHLYLSDFEESKYKSECALDIAQELLDFRHEAEFMTNIGLYYLEMMEFTSALRTFL